jgi:hypothetical protein
MGRARRRARRAAQAGPTPVRRPPAAVEPPAAPAPPAARPDRIRDPEWRRAERRRIARLNRLPDPVRSWADRSRWHAAAAAFLQMGLVIAVTLVLLRVTVGAWLPPYAAVVALALAVTTQYVCRGINARADARAASSP